MSMNRRDFLTAAAAAAAGVAIGTRATERVSAAERPPKTRIKVIAFDAFPVFDPRPIFALAERLFPGKGEALGSEWRTRLFEYTWLRVAAGRYADFWQVTRDALVFAANRVAVELPPGRRDELMNAWL